MENDIFGIAIQDFYNGEKNAVIKVISEDFDEDEIPVTYLFRAFNEMPSIEQKALNFSTGKVLDVGCGAGSHSLYLKTKKKLEVTAIDTSAGAIKMIKQQGIASAFCENFYNHKGKYDTILMLMNGCGIVENLENFSIFFDQLKSLLNKNGQVLLDSSDLIYLFENENGEFWVDAAKGYYGEMKYQIAYKNKISEPFNWLYVDYNTLQRAATLNGFNCELICEGEHYDYLAKLTLE